MPALPSVPSVLRIETVISDGLDNNSMNRFFLHYAGTAPTSAQLLTFANAVGTSWMSRMAALYNASSNYDGTQVEDLTSPTGAAASSIVGGAATRGGGAGSAASCVVVSLLTGRRYRGGHPRQYLSAGGPGDMADRQHWNNTFISAMVTGYQNWNSDIIAAGWAGAGTLQLCAVSYYSGYHNVTLPSGRVKSVPTVRATPLVDFITGFRMNTRIGSQRRRLAA